MKQGLFEQLTEPFSTTEIKWKPQVMRGNRALAVAYVDARAVEDRLDHVFGVDGWQDAYHLLPNASVVCKLRVKIGNEWIEKSDVGGQSDQPDESDRTKSAFSDALKRAAVKLGIGRYLYRLPQQWVNFDPNTRQILQTPQLPEWAQAKEKNDPVAPTETEKPKLTKAAGKISPGQWEQIKANLTTKNAMLRKFLDHFEIQKPRDLSQQQFEEALELSLDPPQEWILQREAAA